MKKTLALLAAFVMSVSVLTACGDDSSSSSKKDKDSSSTSSTADSSSTADESSSAADDTASSEVDADASSEPDATPVDSDTDTDSDGSGDTDIDLSALYHQVDSPEYAPKDAAQGDFVGKWECYCMAGGGIAYDSIMGVPLYAMIHVEIKDDGKAVISSIDDPTAQEEATPVEVSWTYSDNKASFELDGKAAVAQINSDGHLVLSETGDSGDQEFVYFNKVDDYTDFDFSAVKDQFSGLIEE